MPWKSVSITRYPHQLKDDSSDGGLLALTAMKISDLRLPIQHVIIFGLLSTDLQSIFRVNHSTECSCQFTSSQFVSSLPCYFVFAFESSLYWFFPPSLF